ncbi:DUF305 domain-containing protein [Brevundimonas sp. A19_0]|uniref:DUF305 domain-containing protein n=1 Tax=Brevundimonas sp. A19_0 TaxID=2821087 RepID=UPI001ADC431E|nr:DUF305 domain-containing protein [Brevundimonas sp. A19_0]MBO9502237.1 DUF305 domain-containing protein [Brevundimonas sp. A19_0]
MIRSVVLAALALTLTACDGGGDPVQQALRDASAERQAALVKDGEVSGPVAAPDEDTARVQKMIAGHEAALIDARAALDSPDPEVRRLAEQAIESHTTQLADLRAWQAGR